MNSEDFSVEYIKVCEITDDIGFLKTRTELAKYIDEIFTKNSIQRSEIVGNPGVWTWLSYAWFDRIAPKIDGFRRVKEISSYVYVQSYRRSYRHIIASAYQLYTSLGSSLSKLFLECEINKHNDFVEQLASSGYIVSNRSIIEAAHKLYWDSQNERPKLGAQNRGKPGTLRRFKDVLGRLEINFDIYTASLDQILDLLPTEFKRWKTSA